MDKKSYELKKDNIYVPNFVCPLCKQKKENFKGLSYHFTTIHKLDLKQWIIKNFNIQAPRCIECNNEISLNKKRTLQFILTAPELLRFCKSECQMKNEESKKSFSEAGIKGGKATLGRKMSEEQRVNHSKAIKQSYIDNPKLRNMRSEFMSNREVSLETKIKISKANTGKKRTEQQNYENSKRISEMWINNEFKFKSINYLSIKNKKIIHTKSTWELKLAMILDIDDNVLYYEHEKIIIPYTVDNKTKHYIPDFIIYYNNNTSKMIEVGVKSLKDNTPLKKIVGEKYCKDNNINSYEIWDDEDISEYLKTANIDYNNYFIQLNSILEGEILSQIICEKQPFDRIKIINNENYIQGSITFPDINKNELYNSNFKSHYKNLLLEFFPQYYDCRWNKARFSANDCLKNKIPLRHILGKLGEKKEEFNWKNFLSQLHSEKYDISWFRPSIAKWVYKKYLNNIENPKVLDPCGGFGSRLLAFYDTFADKGLYWYNDAWSNNCNSVKEFSNSFNIKNIKISNKYFEEFETEEKFDLIFTSIPYWNIEIYGEVMNYYKDFEEWKNKFLFNLIDKSRALLNSNGKLIIDCNEELYNIINDKEKIKEIVKIKSQGNHLNKLKEKIEYIISI